ncbi:MAG: SUMF1/EgtB/PvdO family nonheme iron enzyme [Gemmataceae bacterium]|nr:SUMF1/EgtB/PvdO family nonheme iron enzyme [Gemmataceae bacterium]
MPVLDSFLSVVGRAVLDKLEESVFADAFIEATPEFADSVWKRWDRLADAQAKRRELQALAEASFEELDEAVERVEKSFGAGPNDELGKTLGNFLHLLPSSLRRRFRRPSHPDGTRFPQALSLDGPSDLLPLLPARLTRFQVGDRPDGLEDWELEQLVDQNAISEVWKAKHLSADDQPHALFHFFIDPKARRWLVKEARPHLERLVRHGPMPGIVPLQAVRVETDPPCVQYAYVEASTLEDLVQDWRDQGIVPDPWQVVDLVQQIAHILGQLHQLHPPMIHRYVRPSNLLVLPDEAGGWQVYLANLGLAGYGGGLPQGSTVDAYVSPEQLRGDRPRTQDDVYALGILWFHLLAGDVTRARPAGLSWRRLMERRGLKTPLLALLETCFDDELNQRPIDAQSLAETILNITLPIRPHALVGLPQVGTGIPGSVCQPGMGKITNSVGMSFREMRPAAFWMGSPIEEFGRRGNEGPRRRITISKGFAIGTTTVTQEQFERVMVLQPSKHRTGDATRLPADSVTWDQAFEFCRRLSAMPEEQSAGRRYRLPTEAEWEYACRGGTTAAYPFGFSIGPRQAHILHPGSEAAWRGRTRLVASFPPNAFGLQDMIGNVWEWCSDWFDSDFYGRGIKQDPTGPETGAHRVVRGGSFRNSPATCRSACRHALAPWTALSDVGFRVVLELASK